MPTLYTADRCPYAARARIVLAEKGIAYEAVEIDLDDRPAWIYEKNATGRVPVYEEDEGLVLPESEVIMEYLEERYPEPALWPVDPAERALGRLWLNRFDDRLGGAYYAARRGDEGRAELDQRLAELEGALEGQPYLSGREFGLADIGYVPWILRGLERFGLELGPATAGLARALLRAARRRGRASRRLGSVTLPPLVDAAWVQEHLGEEDLLLGDVRGPNAHQRGHLPGSIPLVLGSPPPLATRETVQEFAVEVQRRLGRHGVTGQERLVLYDRGDCVGAAASQQAALVAGHPQVAVLAGGVAAWPGELEQGAVELQKTKTALEPRLEAVPTWEELRERLDDPGLTILDVRSEDEFQRPRRLPLRPAPGAHPGRAAPRGRASLRRPGRSARALGDPRARRACPRARRSSPTATRALARHSQRWRSGPPATTPATTRARGTSGRATRTCRQSAERGLPEEGPAQANGLPVLLLGLRLQDLELVARDRGDALFATRNRQA